MEQEEITEKKSRLWLWIVAALLVVGAATAILLLRDNKPAESESDTSVVEEQSTNNVTKTKVETWQSGGVAIAGKYADAEIIDLDNGSYRMYYAAEPEIKGFNAQVYSAISTDGIKWTEEGEIRQNTTFPDVVKLPDGRLRMYFQNERVIKSAVSTDGLKWTNEAGIRIDKTKEGFARIDGVGAPTTVKLSDGSYVMVYAGTIENEKYKPNVPNNKIQVFFYATSTDGLIWQKKGIAFESRNDTLEGFADGPEFVNWDGSQENPPDGGNLRLYFWSYRGIYYSSFQNGQFSTPELAYAGESVDKNVMYSPNPPSDPTLIKINNTWFMYYGQHEKGIFYSTLNR